MITYDTETLTQLDEVMWQLYLQAVEQGWYKGWKAWRDSRLDPLEFPEVNRPITWVTSSKNN